ncbi:MAG: DUF3108 domain-containing protein [Verrucomicrobiaceae bacterium]|nr:DUF3108 domain-containing protein [Verrucomicrobiaceae bacterium]
MNENLPFVIQDAPTSMIASLFRPSPIGLCQLAFCLLATAASAQSWTSSLTRTSAGPLQVPACVLEYELGWKNTLKAGTARITIQEAGSSYWRASAQASSTGFARTLWAYDCTMSSIISKNSLKPVFMQHSETDRSETCRYRVSFQPRRVITESTTLPRSGTASTGTTTLAFSPVEDLLCTILYVRSLPLANGDKITRVVQPWDKPYLTTFEVQGRESIKIGGKAQPCIKLGVQIRKIDRDNLSLSSYKKMKTATIWVSDDAERLPVEMRAEIFVGYMSCRLTNKTLLTGKAARASVPSSASMYVKPPTP